MGIETLIPVLAVIVIGTYFQTVTGFGMGMIVMGVTSGFDLAPMPLIATVISLLTLVNSGVALPGRLHLIDWPAARAVLFGVVPSIVAGVMLLDYLSASSSMVLKFLLGATITYSGVVFALKPTQLPERSSDRSFLLSGLFSGLSGGLFGMAGPPVIFHFYRQPMDLSAVRCMLLLVFAFTSGTRTVFVATQGGLTPDVWLLTAFSVLLVALATYVGRHYPPPLAPATMRRLAFSVLIVIGISLMGSAWN